MKLRSLIIAQTRQFKKNIFFPFFLLFPLPLLFKLHIFLPHAKVLNFSSWYDQSHDFDILTPCSLQYRNVPAYLDALSTSISKTYFCGVALKSVPEQLWFFFFSLCLLQVCQEIVPAHLGCI